MPTVKQIRDAIKAKIETVPGSGVIHTYERYAKDASALAALYYYGAAPTKRLHGWHIRRVAKREVLVDTDRWSLWFTWRIRGFMGLDDADATEELFDTECDAIADAFRADDTLGGLVFSQMPDDREIGIQVVKAEPVLFAGVLCHSAELGLTTQHLL